MRQLNPGLALHLASGATSLCHCWQLTRGDGAVLGFTDHDRDISFGGTIFEAATGLQASEMLARTGFSVGGMEVAGGLISNRISEEDLQAGLYDRAEISIFLVNWNDSSERQLLRNGHIGEVVREDGAFRAEIRGLAQALDQEQGRLYQPLCDADVGDTRCTVNLSAPAFSGTGQVAQTDHSAHVAITGLGAFEAGWFTGGLLRFTSGANVGRAVEISQHRKQGGLDHFDLWQPMAAAISVSDAVELRAGCDKRFGTCTAKFSNHLNYRGFPHIPGTDFMLSYPNKGEGNDGSNLR
ncbi:MAG: beta tubulin [Hyphomicrobiales bacterium]|nr:DUF2163 domain-containing protein [Hyphomicrobiales bacterium]PCJ95692.1 MAG: beta tubulin [Hyphomicrobiales bacterium]